MGRAIDEVDSSPNAFCVELGLSWLKIGEDVINPTAALVQEMATSGGGDFTLPMEN